MAIDDIQKETFFKLLEQIETQVSHLKKKNRELAKENNRLRTKLNDVHKDQTDIFSSITESERIAMKHQVNGLIQKIDKYLEQ